MKTLSSSAIHLFPSLQWTSHESFYIAVSNYHMKQYILFRNQISDMTARSIDISSKQIQEPLPRATSQLLSPLFFFLKISFLEMLIDLAMSI